MRGSEKQIKYASEIINGIEVWANSKLAENQLEAGTAEAVKQYTQKEYAERLVAEIAVVKAVDAKEIEKAESLFDAVQDGRKDVVARLFTDDQEVDAGKVIDTYKDVYYKKVKK